MFLATCRKFVKNYTEIFVGTAFFRGKSYSDFDENAFLRKII
jgi:hypothetical protein